MLFVSIIAMIIDLPVAGARPGLQFCRLFVASRAVWCLRYPPVVRAGLSESRHYAIKMVVKCLLIHQQLFYLLKAYLCNVQRKLNLRTLVWPKSAHASSQQLQQLSSA